MKKFLICGLGSIGQRHVRMIQTVTKGKAEIAAYRSRKLDIVISDKLEATFNQKPEEHYGLTVFDSMETALAWKPDAVFVTNPISMHVATATAAAESGAHVFIEKPLDCTDVGVANLIRAVSKKGVACMVGYQQRYHPGYLRIKQLLDEGALGSLISADLHFGEWLPGMHPYEDYRESHAARKDQGGGVILCLSHEIDMAYWLFGKPRSVYAQGGHLSDLELDVEDTAEIFLSCDNAGREFPVHVHLDFLQVPPRRYIHIVGDKGSLVFDYRANRLEVNLLATRVPEVTLYDTFQRNDMFLQEVADFISSGDKGKKPPIPLEEGVDVLNICLAAKRSLESGKKEVIV
ncbi:MAG: gfo/Idh/MocA family oxidoreductase [Oxalobacter sp.]|nr:MAG: gfo/Idh/MocA family oxidoreductase [Oxalobacter sp.]